MTRKEASRRRFLRSYLRKILSPSRSHEQALATAFYLMSRLCIENTPSNHRISCGYRRVVTLDLLMGRTYNPGLNPNTALNLSWVMGHVAPYSCGYLNESQRVNTSIHLPEL